MKLIFTKGRHGLCVGIALMAFFGNCLFAEDAKPSENKEGISFMSYNVRNGAGMDNKRDFDRASKIINKEKPLVVALQEIDYKTERSGKKDVLYEIASRVGMKCFFAKGISLGSGDYGIGLLFHENPLQIKAEALPGREEKRALIRAEFKDYWIYATHFSLTPEDQMKSLEMIVEWAKACEKPVYVMGDLNFEPDSEQAVWMRKHFQIISDTKQMTYPADKPDKCIDYILLYQSDKVKPSLQVKESKVVEAPVESDHRPVFVVFQ